MSDFDLAAATAGLSLKASPPVSKPPSSVLIIGSGVFGLSTAYTLARLKEFQDTKITVLDRALDKPQDSTSPAEPVFPARDAASIDSSRIIRADYADAAYASLAEEAQSKWRLHTTNPSSEDPFASLGADGRYNASGLFLAANKSPDRDSREGRISPMQYAKRSWLNAMALAQAKGHGLHTIRSAHSPIPTGLISKCKGVVGDWGYLNQNSGWADAESSMDWLYQRAQNTGRINFVKGVAESLVVDDAPAQAPNNTELEGKPTITGARLGDGTTLSADLVIVAAGAWSGKLIDMSSQAVATGQVLAYFDINKEEEEKLSQMSVCLNLSTGFFVMPPRNGVLKVARHAYGYLNPTEIPKPLGAAKAPAAKVPNETVEISVPATHLDSGVTTTPSPSHPIPAEAIDALQADLAKTVPWLTPRPFHTTKICWYTDTPSGDWIIDYHPSFNGLFVATGGSGHGFKFLPILGEKIAGAIMGVYPANFEDKWRWKGAPAPGGDSSSNDKDGAITESGLSNITATEKETVKTIMTEDGSRSGQIGLILSEELKRPSLAAPKEPTPPANDSAASDKEKDNKGDAAQGDKEATTSTSV